MIVDLDIVDVASISPLGAYPKAMQEYQDPKSNISFKNQIWRGDLSSTAQEELELFLQNNPGFRKADRSVQLACAVASKLKAQGKVLPNCGVNAGSSRGATNKLEEAYDDFYANRALSPQTSPLTTAGNVASFIAKTLDSSGMDISHSITCSTFAHGLANAAAWLKAGMAEQFAVFGTEAPLTPFTFAQMRSLGIYSQAEGDAAYPSRPMYLEKGSNEMVLGEGAIGILLQKSSEQAKYRVKSIGYAKESTQSAASVSKEGAACQASMRMALEGLEKESISAIIAHCPGTHKGDAAELEAIKAVFGKEVLVTNNKWKIGHTFGASAGFSLEMAMAMLETNNFYPVPYLDTDYSIKTEMNRILLNAIGFGGNAISVVIERAN